MSWSSHEPGGCSSRADRAFLLAGAVVLVAAAFGHTTASAAVKYSLAAEGGVVALSNPFLLSGNDLGAVLFEGSLSPNASITRADGSSLDIGGTLTGRAYDRRYGQFLLGDARIGGLLRQSERLTARASAAFRRDVSADTLTDDVDAASDPRSVRNAVTAEASLAWTPSARTTIAPRVSFERSSFDRSTVLANTRAINAELVYTRQISDRTSLGIRTTGSISRAGDDGRFDTLGAFATLDRRLSPRWRVNVEAGAERNHDDSRGGGEPGRRNRVTFSGRGQLCNTGEKGDACLNAALASEVSALGTLQRQLSLSATANRRLSPRWNSSVVAEYTKSTREQGGGGPDQSAANFRAVLDWQFATAATLSAEAGYRQRDVGNGLSSDGGFVGLRLRWQR